MNIPLLSSVNRKLRDLPIVRKLILFVVVTTLISLLVTVVAIVVHEQHSFDKIIKRELSAMASMVGSRNAEAIVRGDTTTLEEHLQALLFLDTVRQACLFRLPEAQGEAELLVSASNSAEATSCPARPRGELTIRQLPDTPTVEIFHPVRLAGATVGEVYLRVDTAEFHALRGDHIVVLSLAFIAASLIALALANLFARWILRPLTELGKTAQTVTRDDDYSTRAEKFSEDEVGQVVDSFNRMLTRIEYEDAQLRESEEKFRLISEFSKAGIFQLDADGRCIYANQELAAITGLAVEDILAEGWLRAVHRDDQSVVQAKWRQMLAERCPISINCRLRGQRTRWISGHVGLLQGSDDRRAGFLGTLNDITDVKNAQIQLEQMAFYDTLTGLANRRLFRNRLEHVIDNLSREGSSLGLILLDLDHFKHINDSLGHDSGDALLKVIAERLQHCVRASDTVARLGGDEFAILLPGISTSLAISHIAQKILDTMREPVSLQERDIRISVSAGISIAPDDTRSAETLVKNADLALYRAKDAGRDNYRFFTREMNTQLINHLELVEDMRKAIDKEGFSLVYQPQIDLTNGELIGFEALIRWQHHQRGAISPMEFIPAAEETGLIIPLGRWVISNACRQIKQFHTDGLISDQVAVTVNLSVKQFQDEELVSFIQARLQAFDLKPQQLEIELTETVLMENLEATVTKLQALRELGILISIDDFGTGYSSLGYLKRLPVNIVKVDKSFVTDIPHDKDDMEITMAVIAMAHSLHYQVVAEGVETQEQLAFLRRCGCDFGQGYLFGRPIPVRELEEFIRTYNASTFLPATGF